MIDELERLAKAATPGPWAHDRYNSVNYVNWYGFDEPPITCTVTSLGNDENNSKYIAAANPDTILKLIAVVRAAQNWKKTHHNDWVKDHEALGQIVEALTALEDNDQQFDEPKERKNANHP